jgi:alpha-methylacyl-CoA racemase
MVDGVCNLMAPYQHLRAQGQWTLDREANLVDGGAPFYRAYRCADGRFVAVGCLAGAMYEEFLRGMGLDPGDWPQLDRSRWPTLRDRLGDLFAAEPREHWATRFAGTDACVTEVLDLDEAVDAPHLVARRTFVTVDGIPTPVAAPRLSRTPAVNP